MDYLHTYPDAVIRFHASNMIIKIISDATYRVQHKTCSCTAVHYHLGWNNDPDIFNGLLDILFQTLKM